MVLTYASFHSVLYQLLFELFLCFCILQNAAKNQQLQVELDSMKKDSETLREKKEKMKNELKQTKEKLEKCYTQ